MSCSVDTAIPKEKKNRRILKNSFLTSWKELSNTATVLPADEILKQHTYLCRSCYSNFEQYHNVKQELLKNISAFIKHIGPNDTSSPVKRSLPIELSDRTIEPPNKRYIYYRFALIILSKCFNKYFVVEL